MKPEPVTKAAYIASKRLPTQVNPKVGGYYNLPYFDGNKDQEIPVFRCSVCFQHMSLYNYTIAAGGVVTPDVVCPNCGSKHTSLLFSNFGLKSKPAGEVFVK